MKMTMKELRGYLGHQRRALFSWFVSRFTGIRYVWFISREKYCLYNRVETAPPFSLVWHLERLKERKSCDGPFHTLPSGLTREERRAHMINLARRIKERQTMAAITSVENAPHFTRDAAVEAWKDFDVMHKDITEKSDV